MWRLTLSSTSSSAEPSDFGAENINSMTMYMETINGMPFDLGIQVYFIDSAQNWIRLDSLFKAPTNIIESGEVNDDGRVTRATITPTKVEFTRSQIENALDAEKQLVKAYIATFESYTRDVKFYSDYSLDFKLGTRIEINYTIEPEKE